MKNSTFKTMMIIGMMILGTVTTFGKTNNNVRQDKNRNARTEVVVVKTNNSMIDRHMRPGMDRRFFMNHIMEGRHFFGHKHECTVCHLTKHQIHEIEKEMRHHHQSHPAPPVPAGRPVHFGR